MAAILLRSQCKGLLAIYRCYLVNPAGVQNVPEELGLVIMPSSHLNHQVRYWSGAQNGQNLIWLYKENNFYEQWHLIP